MVVVVVGLITKGIAIFQVNFLELRRYQNDVYRMRFANKVAGSLLVSLMIFKIKSHPHPKAILRPLLDVL
jgi:hypothetical protein